MSSNDLKKTELIINGEMDGTRLDLVLSVALEEFSRSFIQKLFEKGKITVNGSVCTQKIYKASAGDLINIELPEPEKV